MKTRILAAAAALAAITASGKERARRVDTSVPAQYQEQAAGTSRDSADVAQWWTKFRDPQLNALIERSVKRNTDRRTAAARVLEARAMARVERSSLLPSVGVTSAFNRIRGGFAQGVTKVGSGQDGTLVSAFETNSFQAGFDASWELDVFGGNRNATKAAIGDARAAEYGEREVLVTVTAEVARNYIALRGLEKQLEITRRNIEVQRDTLDLTRARAEAGLGSQLDVERQATQLATTQAAEPTLEGSRRQTVQRLAVLVGERPEALPGLDSPGAIPSIPAVVGVGLPSDLLRRRPDLRRAEAEVSAAAARTGAARSDLFPKFVITGLTGRQSTNLGGFTLGAGNFFSVGPGIQLPIFSGGRIRANIAAQNARLDQAVARYEGTLLNALADVENALTAYGREQERRARLEAAVRSSRTAVGLANELYTRGLSDFISVLDAERAQYGAEDELVRSETAVVENLVALYKALGGGWE